MPQIGRFKRGRSKLIANQSDGCLQPICSQPLADHEELKFLNLAAHLALPGCTSDNRVAPAWRLQSITSDFNELITSLPPKEDKQIMSRFFSFIAILLIIAVCIGFFRGWFSVSSDRQPVTENLEVNFQVDQNKMQQDAHAVEEKTKSFLSPEAPPPPSALR